MSLVDIAFVAFGIGLGAFALLWWIRRWLLWETIYEASMLDPGDAFALYAALQHERVRARFEGSRGIPGFGGHYMHSHLTRTVRVKVHRDDVHRAHEVRTGR